MNTQELLSPATQRPRTPSPVNQCLIRILINVGAVVSFPASQSLQASASLNADAVSTGLPQLDDAISPPLVGDDGDSEPRGIPQGQVTEVFGPPGVGKTSLAYVVL